MKTDEPLRVLCVDDEQSVLDALSRCLRTRYSVQTASSAIAALKLLEHEKPFMAVISDLKMPDMDGVSFLAEVRATAPDTIRILLTGHADLEAAMAAVNEGHIFRFLTKPCPPRLLLMAVDAAAEQHRLIMAERVLLQQTLRGSIKALTDVLGLANPAAFGRASRARQGISKLAEHLGLHDQWQVEVAAMLSQIGCVTLPPDVTEKLYHGQALTQTELAMTDRLPEITEQLLANIPRLETVREILRYQNKRFDGTGPPDDGVRREAIPWGARALKAVLDLDSLQAQGMSTQAALDTMSQRRGWYDESILQALAEIHGSVSPQLIETELSLWSLQAGMIFAEDVTTPTGLLLVARGQEVTPSLLERIKNFSLRIGVKEPIRMLVKRPAAPDH